MRTGFAGQWDAENGVIHQKNHQENNFIMTGQEEWDDYTLSLKARKLSGAEGFLILFRSKNEDNWHWWNLGGWGNSSHAIERMADSSKEKISDSVQGSIKTGQWYDIRITVQNKKIKCWLNDKLIHDVDSQSFEQTALEAGAGYDKKSEEWIIKVVNKYDESLKTDVSLDHLKARQVEGTITILTSNSPKDENSFDNPRKVIHKSKLFGPVASKFTYDFPPYSLTIFRLREVQ